MYKCDVYIDGSEKPYQGQYEIDNEFLASQSIWWYIMTQGGGSTVLESSLRVRPLVFKIPILYKFV